jgi:hypothetical protein
MYRLSIVWIAGISVLRSTAAGFSVIAPSLASTSSHPDTQRAGSPAGLKWSWKIPAEALEKKFKRMPSRLGKKQKKHSKSQMITI